MKTRSKWILGLGGLAFAGFAGCVAPWILIGVGMTVEDTAQEKALREHVPTSLADAVSWKYTTPEAVAKFIDAGEDVRQTFAFAGGPPQPLVRYAAQTSHVEVARLLIRRGAPVEDVGLWECVRLGNEPMARMLIEEGASLDSRSQASDAASQSIGPELIQAAAAGHQVWLLRQLVARGADPRLRNPEGEGLLTLALANQSMSPDEERGSLETTAALLALGADPEAVDENGSYPLYWAAYHGKTKELAALLDAGAALEGPAAIGAGSPPGHPIEPPLAVAVEHCQPQAVDLLLARGASLAARTADGKTLTEGACAYGYPEVNRKPRERILLRLKAGPPPR